MTKVDWLNISCFCGEKRKNTKSNKVWFDEGLSDKQKGIMVFFCTNNNPKFHSGRIHFTIKIFDVKDDIVSVKLNVMRGELPKKNKNKKE